MNEEKNTSKTIKAIEGYETGRDRIAEPSVRSGAPYQNPPDAETVANQTMKAIRIHRQGGPGVLQYEDAPRPKPKPGEVLIRVHAAGVNPIDWKVREGYPKDFLMHTLPLIPGWDLSGVVEEVGPGGSRFNMFDWPRSRS
jgi:hypothetical protein